MSITRRVPLLLLLAALIAAVAAMPVLADGGEDGDDDHGIVVGSTAVGGIGPTSAQASSELTPDEDGTTSFRFEYGPTTAYGDVTPTVTVAEGDDPIAVSALLDGLDASTRYHVRLVARSGLNWASSHGGPAATFTTTAVPAVPADPTEPAEPVEPNTATPVQGKAVVASPAKGTLRIRVPGATTFSSLVGPTTIPVGSRIDARKGKIDLASAHAGGTQTGRFWGTIFAVRQRRTGSGATALHLRGGSFARCSARSAGLAQTAARKRKRRVRSLWGKDKGGRFRTHGRDSVATVRGTTWQVVDRCDGTVTRVTEGSVEVRDRRRRARVLVQAGGRYLARHR